MTHPDDNRPPPSRETQRGQHHDDQHRADARAAQAEAPRSGGSAGVGTEPTRNGGPEDPTRATPSRELPAPVLTR